MSKLFIDCAKDYLNGSGVKTTYYSLEKRTLFQYVLDIDSSVVKNAANKEKNGYFLDMFGVDAISPSVATKILQAIAKKKLWEDNMPVVMKNCNFPVISSMRLACLAFKRNLWVVDLAGYLELLGDCSPQTRDIVNFLIEKDDVTASELAETLREYRGKTKNVGTYLQRLYRARLLSRKKILSSKPRKTGGNRVYSYLIPRPNRTPM